jgi:hypothetical protein
MARSRALSAAAGSAASPSDSITSDLRQQHRQPALPAPPAPSTPITAPGARPTWPIGAAATAWRSRCSGCRSIRGRLQVRRCPLKASKAAIGRVRPLRDALRQAHAGSLVDLRRPILHPSPSRLHCWRQLAHSPKDADIVIAGVGIAAAKVRSTASKSSGCSSALGLQAVVESIGEVSRIRSATWSTISTA